MGFGGHEMFYTKATELRAVPYSLIKLLSSR